jgi:hypothetical protein
MENADDWTLRRISTLLATSRTMYGLDAQPKIRSLDLIDGLDAKEWALGTLSPKVAKMPRMSPLRQLRLDGLMAAWKAPGSCEKFFRQLPLLLRTLDRAGRTREEVDDDVSFLRQLDLISSVDPDEFVSLCLAHPEMYDFLLEQDLRKPSVENQKRLYRWAITKNTGVRATIFSKIAVWNDAMDLRTRDFSPGSGQASVVENEAMVRAGIEKLLNLTIDP